MRIGQDFSQGKMNKDVDSRYMPRGQYREARNARVLDTDDGNSGVIESMDGDLITVDEPLWTPGSRVVGMYEYNNKIYHFTALKQGGFSILEHDSVTGESSHVLVDQLSTMKEEDGLKNTICFLHNKSDENSIFNAALNAGFGWYVPSKEEIEEAVGGLEEGIKILISETDKEIVDFNDKNVAVGTVVSVKPGTRARIMAAGSDDGYQESVNYYWTSSEIDKEHAYVYGTSTGLLSADKQRGYLCLIIRRFRFDNPPEVGSTYDDGVIYKVDMEKKEARALRLMPGSLVYDSTPEILTQSLVTNFNMKTEISGFCMLENIMIFNDLMSNEPVEIDITRTKGYYKFYDWTAMKLVKRPPVDVKVEVADKSELSEMRNMSPVFAARYLYDTRETSAISPYSNASSMIDKTSKDYVSADMMVEVHVAYQKIYYTWFFVDQVTGSRTKVGEISADVPEVTLLSGLGQSQPVNFMIKPARARALNVKEKGFDFQCPINFRYKHGTYDRTSTFFIFGDSSSSSKVKVALDNTQGGASARNCGSDINENGDVIFFANSGEAAGSNNGQLRLYAYDKDNNYLDYTEGIVGDGVQDQGAICMSSSGKYVYAVYKSNFSYSTNYGKGNTWTKVDMDDFISTVKSPRGENLICSADGQVIYMSCKVTVDDPPKYTIVSRDYGKSFTLVTSNENYMNRYMACSSNGRNVAIAGDTLDNVYYSKEYGNALSKTRVMYLNNPSAYKVNGITMNSTGRVMYVMASLVDSETSKTYTSYVFMSNDFGETMSVVSNYSKQSVWGGSICFTKSSFESETLNEINNAASSLDITVNTGNSHVEKIEILMKTGAGMYKVKTVDKKKEGLKDNVDYKYRFTYSGNYPLIPIKDVTKLFDNVPLKARTCMILQNSVIFGGYVDGFNIDTDISLSASIENVSTGSVNYSLKTGVTQGYGIVFYDEFGRCSPVLAPTEATAKRLNESASSVGRVATIKITGTPPSWARYFRFVRRNPRIMFDVINGFDNAYLINGKVYLEITSSPWIVPNAGDKIELVSESDTLPDEVSTKGYVFEIKDRVQVTGEPGKLSVTLSDGTKVALGDEDTSDVPNGRYVVIEPTSKPGYTSDDILKKDTRFTTSVFYVIMHDEKKDDIVYQEIPGTYEIDGSIAKSYRLDQDGDVMIGTSPVREMNRFSNGNMFSTLGRPNAISENYSEEDRFASLTVSEQYVVDTKDNGLSSFNTGLVNYKDLDKKFGEIVKIDDISSDIDVFQTNKCSRVMYKKNVLNTADGSSLVAKSEDIFGEQQDYAEDAGMSHYKTYARNGLSRYFVDSRTGNVFRKSVNGLFPISGYGMSNYFHDNLSRDNVICGGFNPRQNSYVLGLKKESVNFIDHNDGWSSFYDSAPEWMTRAGGSLFSSKDAIIRIHGGDPLHQNQLLGEVKDTEIKLVNNELPDNIKVYNNIIMETNVEPFMTVFKSGGLSSSLSSMVRKENLFESYIPKACKPTPVLVFFSDEDFEGDELTIINADHVEPDLGVYVDNENVAMIESVNDNVITLTNGINVPANTPVYVRKFEHGVNGDALRGKYVEINSYFSTVNDEKILVKSIQIDIDESKI